MRAIVIMLKGGRVDLKFLIDKCMVSLSRRSNPALKGVRNVAVALSYGRPLFTQISRRASTRTRRNAHFSKTRSSLRAYASPQHHLMVRDFVTHSEDYHLNNEFDNSYEACYTGSSFGFPASLSDKLVVAVDVDEVIGNFVSALNSFIADRYSLFHSISEYYVYEFFKIWNCSRDEADTRVHEFFKTPYFKTGINPIPGAQQVLIKLARKCRLSVVTSRQNVIKEHTVEWIERNFPGVFEEIHFGNHFALQGESRSKSEICRALGATVLIDDNPSYAIDCAEAGIRVLLFDYENSYPWCKLDSAKQHPLVTKVYNWQQIERLLALLLSLRRTSSSHTML